MSRLEGQPYVQSQYGNSPTIKALLQAAAERIAPDADMQLFYDNVFNIMTAKGVGLDIWGRILGITRDITLNETIPITPLFGFKNSDCQPFNQGVFYIKDNVESGNRILATIDDDNYRNLLLFKAMANICTADIGTLNTLTNMVYNDNNVIVTNIVTDAVLPNGDRYNASPMLISWVWRKNNISNLNRALLLKTAALCVAAGVGYIVDVISKDPLFGFAGSNLNPFNQGAFGTIQIMEDDINGNY